MDQAEASGKTVEDALNHALSRLGASADEVEITVLDEGKRGFLGRGARDAHVRVVRRPAGQRAPGAQEPPDTRIPHAPPATAPRSRQPRARRPSDRSRGSADAAVPRLTDADFLSPGAAAGPEPRRPSRAPRAQRPQEEPTVAPDINAEQVDFAAGIVDDFLRLLDITAEISIREPVTAGDGLGSALAVIDILGEGLGLLIGRRGETLLALQYLVNLIVSRRYPGKGGVTIDVEHYRHRREEQVIALARRMADRVREDGNPITLEPMSPAERRLVHMQFAEDEAVETNSIGEGEHRKVVISVRRRGHA